MMKAVNPNMYLRYFIHLKWKRKGLVLPPMTHAFWKILKSLIRPSNE